MEQTRVPFFEWTPRQVVLGTLVVVGLLIAAFLIYWLRLVIFALFSAILLSTAIRPVSDWLQRRGVSRPISVILVFLLLTAALVFFIIGLVPIFGETGIKLTETVRVYYNNLRTAMIESPSKVIRELAYSLPWSFQGQLPTPGPAGDEDALNQALGWIRQIVNVVLILVAVLLLTFFWLMERERAILSILMFFPASRRDSIQEFYLEMEKSVGSYLRGLVFLSFAIFVLALIAYLIIGLPNALFLAVVAGVFEAVPMVGPFLGAIPAVLIAVAVEPTKAIWVIVATIIIQQVEQYLLVPRVMRQSAGVNEFVTLLALAAFGSMFGLPGAMLAIPLAVVIQLVLQRFVLDPEKTLQPTPTGRDYASKLRYEAQELVKDIRKQVREKEDDLDGNEVDEVEEAIELLANDLDSLLAGLSEDAKEASPS
jgi:predicted PurR-regulated permease PerM